MITLISGQPYTIKVTEVTNTSRYPDGHLAPYTLGVSLDLVAGGQPVISPQFQSYAFGPGESRSIAKGNPFSFPITMPADLTLAAGAKFIARLLDQQQNILATGEEEVQVLQVLNVAGLYEVLAINDIPIARIQTATYRYIERNPEDEAYYRREVEVTVPAIVLSNPITQRTQGITVTWRNLNLGSIFNGLRMAFAVLDSSGYGLPDHSWYSIKGGAPLMPVPPIGQIVKTPVPYWYGVGAEPVLPKPGLNQQGYVNFSWAGTEFMILGLFDQME